MDLKINYNLKHRYITMLASTEKIYSCFVKQIESQLHIKLSDALTQDKLVTCS